MNNTSTVNNLNQAVTNWDDFINDETSVPTQKQKPKPRKKSNVINLDDEEENESSKLQEVKQKKPEKEKTEKFSVSADPLMKDARDKLNYYLKKIPSFTTISSQINILNSEMNTYRKIGEIEKYNSCKEIIKTLQEKTKEIKSIFSPIEGEKAKAKRLENLANIKASETIKDLMAKEKEIRKAIDENSVNKLVQNVSQLRKMLKFAENDDEIIDFDDFIKDDTKNSEIYENYNKALTNISEITGLEIQELYEMPISHIKDFLKDNIDESSFNEELKVIRAQIQSEKDNLSGALTLSNIINNLYDIKNNEKDVVAVKEIVASAHIGMVKSIAYSVCSSNGGLKSMQYIDDCVSAGLFALTGAINDWIKLQQSYPVSLSFKGWARVNITNAVKRELLSQQSGGRVSGSRIADMISRENKKIQSFLDNFPQYKEFDREFVKELVTTMDVGDNKKVISTNDIKPIFSESEIMAGAEDGNGADMWANINSEDFVDMTELKSEYNELISSISELLKTMNKFEKKLFMMYFGFEKKLERDDTGKKTVSNKYTQAEIGVELYDFYVSNGAKPKAIGNSFSQPAIFDKIKKLEKHITNEINKNPKLKLGFDYLFIYWTQNSHLLEVMSNNREEIGMKLERDILREYYKDDEEVSNIQLSDGKKLSEIFDISSSNPLDSDIEDFYNNSGL